MGKIEIMVLLSLLAIAGTAAARGPSNQNALIRECHYLSQSESYHGIMGGIRFNYWNQSTQTVWNFQCNGDIGRNTASS
jgi:hypothetical protein